MNLVILLNKIAMNGQLNNIPKKLYVYTVDVQSSGFCIVVAENAEKAISYVKKAGHIPTLIQLHEKEGIIFDSGPI